MEYLAVVTEGILYEIPIWILLNIIATIGFSIATLPFDVVSIIGITPLTCGLSLPIEIISEGTVVVLECIIVPAFALAGATISGVIGSTLGYMTNMLMNLIFS